MLPIEPSAKPDAPLKHPELPILAVVTEVDTIAQVTVNNGWKAGQDS